MHSKAHTFDNLQFLRHPISDNKTLRAWNAADEHLLKVLHSWQETNGRLQAGKLTIVNDRFGFLSTNLASRQPNIVRNLQWQQQAITNNLYLNGFSREVNFKSPLDVLLPQQQIGLINIPKSLDLFQLYLYQLSVCLDSEGTVYAGFMTRNFSPQLLKIAAKYFREVQQTKAWKKSRVLVLKKPIQSTLTLDFIHKINFGKEQYQQYYGVFSAKHIDYATQFLIQHLATPAAGDCVLDLASGNGILAACIRNIQENCQIHLIDDSFLAVASSQKNIATHNSYFHHHSNLSIFKDAMFDWIISNPPFHFEYDIDINIPLKLFREVHRCLSANGQFMLVYNRHLNYQNHLKEYFSRLSIVAQNDKFIILLCGR